MLEHMLENLGPAPVADKVDGGNTMRLARSFGVLPLVVTVLALGDGLLHLYLRFVLFSRPPGGPPTGATPRPPGPGPGSGPPVRLPLPLPTLFMLYIVGYLV